MLAMTGFGMIALIAQDCCYWASGHDGGLLSTRGHYW